MIMYSNQYNFSTLFFTRCLYEETIVARACAIGSGVEL